MTGSGPAGPLAGTRVVELAGLGPAPHAAGLLADLGADVVRVQRPGRLPARPGPADAILRNRRVVEVDLKVAGERDAVLDVLDRADVLLEGFLPGVTERLGLGPEVVLRRNRGWSTAGSPGGARPGRWRTPPGTTSTT